MLEDSSVALDNNLCQIPQKIFLIKIKIKKFKRLKKKNV